MKCAQRLLGWTLSAVVVAALATLVGTLFGAVGTGQAASSAAPSEKNPPTISGTAQDGKTLTADHGDWNGPRPISYRYQWLRCDATGGGCAGISGATARLYDLRGQDVGHTLRVRVVVRNSGGRASDTSVPTAVVTTAPPAPPPTGCPSGNGEINVAGLTAPARLSIDGFTSSPSVLARRAGALTIRIHVSACSGRAVQGAFVYAAAIPFNQFTVAPEVQTGADGWATITEPQLGGYPVSKRQRLLAVFLRARKLGEPQGGGVSTSRLVSLPVNLHQ
jgi:hypothetical protein